MNMERFRDKLMTALREYTGEEAEIRTEGIRKNNGVMLTGIYVYRKGVDVTPTIYLEEYYKRYEEGETFASIMREITGLLEEKGRVSGFDVSSFTSFESASGRIVMKLINAEKNRELLESVPHIPFLDLAIVFYYILGDVDYGNASIQINRKHMEMWGADMEDICELARKNSPVLLPGEILPMEELMRGILTQDVKRNMKDKVDESELEEMVEGMMNCALGGNDAGIPMFILTNSRRYFGAAALLYPDILESFAERTGGGIFILPSSIHEVILLADDGTMDVRELREMVRTVNETQVAAEEVLSDEVYYYDPAERQVKIMSCADRAAGYEDDEISLDEEELEVTV